MPTIDEAVFPLPFSAGINIYIIERQLQCLLSQIKVKQIVVERGQKIKSIIKNFSPLKLASLTTWLDLLPGCVPMGGEFDLLRRKSLREFFLVFPPNLHSFHQDYY